MNSRFVISDWAAFAAGLHSQAQWRAWARGVAARPIGYELPPLADMPAMARRRLGPLGRAAAQAAYWCQRADLGMPVVLASRYGDVARSLALLADLARDEALSPTEFGLSVHNAIGAQISIARADTANYVCLAGGAASAGNAVFEAAGLLHDGAPEALVLCYDEPLPGDYSVFADEAEATYAWAWRLTLPRGGQPFVELDCTSTDDDPAARDAHASATLPFGLDVLRFVLSGDAMLRRRADGHLWTWRHHDG